MRLRKASIPQEPSYFIGNETWLGYERQVAATGQAHVLSMVNTSSELAQALLRDEEISITGQDQRRYADLMKPARYIELLHQPEAMCHDALIGLPTLLRDKLEEGTGPLPAAEEQVEELVDEGVIGRQRIARKNEAGNDLE